MNAMTVNDEVGAALAQATNLTEVRNVRGKVLGFFAPVNGASQKAAPPEVPAGTAPLQRMSDEEEIQLCKHRLATESGGKSLREVFEYLCTLTDNPADLVDLQRHIHNLGE